MLESFRDSDPDKFDLWGNPLMGLKNDYFPKYGGYKRELDYDPKPSVGKSYLIMTEAEEIKKQALISELLILNKSEDPSIKRKLDIPDYSGYFANLPLSKIKIENIEWIRLPETQKFRNKYLYASEIVPSNFEDYDPLNFNLNEIGLGSRKWICYNSKKIFYIN
jgi:hypothetical protein